MDLSKIFLKDACPTAIGGQAVMEGVMMRGPERTAIAIRLPDGRIHTKTKRNKKPGVWAHIPILRGCVSFFVALIGGMQWLTYSADVLEHYMEAEAEPEEPGRLEGWLTKKFGPKAVWNLLLFLAVAIALVISIGVFVLLPTVLVGWLKAVIDNEIALNLIEGVLRIAIFLLYILAIRRMEDIKRVFQYHGAEHKTIHCFENGLALTPENARDFYTLHPRCGTSFLMFVMVISLILFSLLGWPNLVVRIGSRILLIPVVAGLSYELLKWAGRSNNWLVKVLSMPGLYLQKLTTNPPDDSQVEIAMVSLKAVLVPADTPLIEGICDKDAHLLEVVHIKEGGEA